MGFLFLVPISASIANIAIIAFHVNTQEKPRYARSIIFLYLMLAAWNLSVAFMISANSPEEAWFYLFILRHFFFLIPPSFLWFCLTFRGSKLNFWFYFYFVFAFTLMATAFYSYLSNNNLLIVEMRQYSWDYFPLSQITARYLLGAFFFSCIGVSYYYLLKGNTNIKDKDLVLKVAILFAIWWLAVLTAAMPFVGFDFLPLGNVFDVSMSVIISTYLATRSKLRSIDRKVLIVAGFLSSISIGLLASWLLLEFATFSTKITNVLVGLVSSVISLVFFQIWFNRQPYETKSRTVPVFIKLQNEFGLTYQEANICDLLFNGKSKAEIISKLDITNGTMRNHLSQIYSKTIVSVSEEDSKARDKLQKLTVFIGNLNKS